MPASADRNQEFRNSPIYWFLILNDAKDRHDFEQAAEAKRQLARLGVNVTFRRQRKETTCA